MTFQPGSMNYTQAFGSSSNDVAFPHYDTRAPSATDILYPVGKRWVNISGNAEYVLTSFSSSQGVTQANWALLGQTAGTLDTLTGDSGGAITPTAGNIDLLGTANEIVTTGAGSTITFSLDPEVVIATSIETPLIIAGDAGSMGIQMGDNAGADAINFLDSDAATVASVDSNGGIAAVNLVTSGTTQTLGNSNSATTVAIAGGTGGNTIGIGTGINASAQTVNISSGAAGANSTVNILSGNATSGTQTLNLATGTGGKVVHVADGAGANTVTVGSTNSTSATTVQSGSGGTTLSAANGTVAITSGTGAMNISADAVATTVALGTGAAAKTVTVGSTNTTSTTTIQAGSGGITMTGAITASSNLTLNGAATQLRVHGGAVTDFIGTGTLTAGTVTIANTNIAAADRIFIERISPEASTALGVFSYSISAATSFTVTALNPTDASTQTNDVSTFAYFIVRQTA